MNPDGENRIIAAADDGRSDIFFVRETDVIWGNGYRAKHLGCKKLWDGTGEIAGIAGKNRIEDLFNGAEDDSAVLYLTDTDNGDALFVDDIYGNSYQNVALDHARLANLNEIRAGNGDDLVDLTSRQFEYQGNGLIIRGGNGNDTIWANHGENKLFGDAGCDRIVGTAGNDWIIGGAGNDSMHGGGGDDIFTFCDQWGNDVVEQLGIGSVTLWFENGSIENWDAGKMLYSDSVNSVQVIGADSVYLEFGDDGSNLFASLDACGAFLAESSRNIFEENGVDKIYITL